MFTLANDFGDLIPLVAIAGGCGIAMVSMISGIIKHSVRTRQHEESRCEIAAYVAEGSIGPDDAQKLIEAGAASWKKGRCC